MATEAQIEQIISLIENETQMYGNVKERVAAALRSVNENDRFIRKLPPADPNAALFIKGDGTYAMIGSGGVGAKYTVSDTFANLPTTPSAGDIFQLTANDTNIPSNVVPLNSSEPAGNYVFDGTNWVGKSDEVLLSELTALLNAKMDSDFSNANASGLPNQTTPNSVLSLDDNTLGVYDFSKLLTHGILDTSLGTPINLTVVVQDANTATINVDNYTTDGRWVEIVIMGANGSINEQPRNAVYRYFFTLDSSSKLVEVLQADTDYLVAARFVTGTNPLFSLTYGDWSNSVAFSTPQPIGNTSELTATFTGSTIDFSLAYDQINNTEVLNAGMNFTNLTLLHQATFIHNGANLPTWTTPSATVLVHGYYQTNVDNIIHVKCRSTTVIEISISQSL